MVGSGKSPCTAPFPDDARLRRELADCLDFAIAIAKADFGNVQLLDSDLGELVIVAQHGFPEWWVQYWDRVSAGQGSCGTALERGFRVVVEDVETSSIFDAERLEVQRRAGVRAVQSTPIIGHTGQKLGIFSTHYRSPGSPDGDKLALLDLLARQLANVIERARLGAELSRSPTAMTPVLEYAAALKRSEARFRGIVESMSDGVLLVDERGEIELVNEPALRMFGYSSSQELVGKSVLTLVPESIQEKHRLWLQECFAAPSACGMDGRGGRGPELQITGLRKDGSEFPVEIALSPVRNPDDGLTVTTLMRDISERQRIESERRHLLERERKAKELAESANRSKDVFLAMLSHELRTPLTAILGVTQLLELGEGGPEENKRYLKIIESSAKTQAQLIDDLLDVSRILSGKIVIRPERIEIGLAVSAAVDQVRPSAEAKQQTLTFEQPASGPAARVNGDPTRVQQIVWNLLVNAVKFTPAKGRISVRVSTRGERLRIEVADDGKGIPAESLTAIFDRFMQVNQSMAREVGGLGLGLSLVRHLVELQGGVVWAESPGLGMGSTFIVEFPRV